MSFNIISNFFLLKSYRAHIFYVLIIGLLVYTISILTTPEEKALFLLKIKLPETLVINMYADNPEVIFFLANSYMGNGKNYDLNKAEQYLDRLETIDKNFPQLHYQRARIYFVKSRFRDALYEVNQEILKRPDFSRSYYMRGLIYGYDNNLSGAASDFTEFVRREPDEWAGYNDLAWILFQQGDYYGVKEVIEEILPYSRNAWLLNAYGVALLNLNDNEKALEALLEAKDLASRLTPEIWGHAYTGNNPIIYETGLIEMRHNIEENIERVNKSLLKNL